MQEIIIGDCRLIHGDAYEELPKLGWVGALAFDPPYEFKTSGGGKMRAERKLLDKIQDNELDKGFDYSIMCPLLQFNSVVVFCHNDQLPEILKYISGNFSRFVVLTYHKSNPPPFRNKNYLPDTEFFIHAWNDGGQPVGKHKDMRRFYVGKNGKDTSIEHPTPKPLKLMNKIIKNVNSDIVCDPFMGSGSTALACIQQGRKFIGIEKNETFFNEAVKRIEEFYKNALTKNNQ